jgi:hypothetical protein
MPSRIEIVSGATENELVLVGSRAHLSPGESVLPKVVQPPQVN